MPIIQITEKHILEAAKLCRQVLDRDIMPDFLFEEKVFEDKDFNPNLNLAYTVDEKIVGIISAVIRETANSKKGFVKFICVQDEYKRRKFATNLYERVISYMASRGVKEISIGDSAPNYYFPGIDPFYTEAICFFEHLGFSKFNDTANLIVDLNVLDFSDLDTEISLINKGEVVVRRFETEDWKSLYHFLKEEFEGWVDECESSCSNRASSLFIAIKEDEVIGFSAFEGNNKGTGWFGPMGVKPEYRNLGLGKVLFLLCLKDLSELGFSKATIPWVGPIPFYTKFAAAKVNRVFWRYKKILD